MPAVYAHTGFADARTDYFIWNTQKQVAPPRIADLAVADLAARLLDHV